MLTLHLVIRETPLLTQNPNFILIVLLSLIPLYTAVLLALYNILPSLLLTLHMLSNKFVSLCIIYVNLIYSLLSASSIIFRILLSHGLSIQSSSIVCLVSYCDAD